MKGGGQAFPRIGYAGDTGHWMTGQTGMTMRQFYKAQALSTLHIIPPGNYSANDLERKKPQKDAAEVAKLCGIYADAMIAEDEENNG